jgi:hypothetical protein
MRDLFDDFLADLRKREASARGQSSDPEDEPEGPGETATTEEDPVADERADPSNDADEPRVGPRPVFERGRRGGGPPRRRGPGGPNDGDDFGGRAARAGRRFGLWAVIVAVLAIVVLFGVGLDLWTDALWYASVGFDSVFWTRLTATLGLFVGAGLLAAVVLFANLWLARRLSPPPSEGGAGSLRGFIDRLNEAAAQAGDPRRRPGSGF